MLVFEGKVEPLYKTRFNAQRKTKEFFYAYNQLNNNDYRKGKTKQLIVWNFPSNDYVKFNLDELVRRSSSVGYGGFTGMDLVVS